MKKVISGCVLAAGVLGFSSAQALIIDEFMDPLQIVSLTAPGQDGSEEARSDALGGFRDIFIDATTGNGVFSDATAVAGLDEFTVSLDSGVNASVAITWDGSDGNPTSLGSVNTTGLGGLDLTQDGANAILVDILAIDLDVTLTFTAWDTSGNTGSNSFTASDPTGGRQEVSYAGFGGVDFSSIGALQLTITGPEAFDTELDFIATNATDVPEPQTLLLMSLGLVGLGFATTRSRRKR